MKVVAFNGSPRENGNTAQAIRTVFVELENQGIQTELVHIGGKKLQGCIGCRKCFQTLDRQCSNTDDEMNSYIEKMDEADGIIIGSPVYFGNVTASVKALIERGGYVARANGDMLKRKAGAAVVSVRRAGSNFTFAAINFFFTISQMIIPGSNYWNMTLSRDPADFKKDEEGIKTFKVLGENMAWIIKKIAG
jgi:multimeric flavodoxin WrbA